MRRTDEQPIDLEELRRDDERINNAGRSGDPVVDGLKRMFDEGR